MELHVIQGYRCPVWTLENATHLFRLHTLQGGVDVVSHSHVDEPVLGLRLNHARPLSTHHQCHLLYVDLTVQTWGEHNILDSICCWSSHSFNWAEQFVSVYLLNLWLMLVVNFVRWWKHCVCASMCMSIYKLYSLCMSVYTLYSLCVWVYTHYIVCVYEYIHTI